MTKTYQIEVDDNLWSLFKGTKQPETNLNEAVNKLIADRVARYYSDPEQIELLYEGRDDLDDLVEAWELLQELGPTRYLDELEEADEDEGDGDGDGDETLNIN